MEDRENSNSLEGRIIQGDFRHQRHSILGLALYLSAGTLAAVGACELYMQGNYFWAASVAWTLVSIEGARVLGRATRNNEGRYVTAARRRNHKVDDHRGPDYNSGA